MQDLFVQAGDVMIELQKALIRAEGMVIRYQTSAQLPLFLRAEELVQEEKEVRQQMKSCVDVLVGMYGNRAKDPAVLMEMRTLSEQLTRAMSTTNIAMETLDLSHEVAAVLRTWDGGSGGCPGASGGGAKRRPSCDGLMGGSEGVAAVMVRMELLVRVGDHLGMTIEEMMEEQDILLREREELLRMACNQTPQQHLRRCSPDNANCTCPQTGNSTCELLEKFAELLQVVAATQNRHGSGPLMPGAGTLGSSTASCSAASSGGAGALAVAASTQMSASALAPVVMGLGLSSSSSAVSGGSASQQTDMKRRELEERVTCPICLRVMENPVTVRSGMSYCRECIINWFREGRRECPVTRQTLFGQELYPNFFLRSLIERLRTGRGLMTNGGGALMGKKKLAADPISGQPLHQLPRHHQGPVILPPRRQPSDPSPIRGLLLGVEGLSSPPAKAGAKDVIVGGGRKQPARPPHFRTASAPVPYSPLVPPLSGSSPPVATSQWPSAGSSPSSVSAMSSGGDCGSRQGAVSGPLVIGIAARDRYSGELVNAGSGPAAGLSSGGPRHSSGHVPVQRRGSSAASAVAVPVIGSGVQPKGVAGHSRHKSVRTDMYCLSQWVEVAKAPPGAEWRVESARALRELASHKDNHTQLVHEGAVEPLLSFLSSDLMALATDDADTQTECVEHCVSALAFLAVDYGAQAEIERLGGESVLVRVASSGLSILCCELAASALWTLSSSPVMSSLAADAAMVEALGKLRWKGCTGAVQESAAHALVNIASRGFSEGILKGKGLPFLMELAVSPPTPVCVETAIDAISKMSSLEDHAKSLCDMDAVGMLLRLSQSGSQVVVVEKAVQTLWNVSFVTNGKQRIAEYRGGWGLGWMVEIAARNDWSPKACEAAAGVLWNLATVSCAVRKEIRSRGGVGVLLGVVRGGRAEGCKDSALGCLLNLSLDEGGRVEILDSKGVALLCEWLFQGMHSLKSRTKSNIIRTLGYLALHDVASLRVWMAGGTHQVVRVLKDKGVDRECHEVSVMTLVTLVRNDKNRSVVMKEGGLPVAIELGMNALAAAEGDGELQAEGNGMLATHVAGLLAAVAMAKKKRYVRAMVRANALPFLLRVIGSETAHLSGIVQALHALRLLLETGGQQENSLYRSVRDENGINIIAASVHKCRIMAKAGSKDDGCDQSTCRKDALVTITLGAEVLYMLANDAESRIAIGREQQLLSSLVDSAMGRGHADGIPQGHEGLNSGTVVWKARLSSIRLLAKLAQDSEVHAQSIARAGGGVGAMAIAADVAAMLFSGSGRKGSSASARSGAESSVALGEDREVDIFAGAENALMLVNVLLAGGNRLVEDQLVSDSCLETLRLLSGDGPGHAGSIKVRSAANACISNLARRGARFAQAVLAAGLVPAPQLEVNGTTKSGQGSDCDGGCRVLWMCGTVSDTADRV
ncbi:hypothetical protein CBR_g6716 [Chara braunii]|uniref:RING-type E3 ubiquitin transferase n=1 Tax=Chara braunii TaxID=69332 RepID=A0A388KKL4_CHABU|nr:hypothetical protein CBR_g6716 [Chara braunii]|eukprot:GBG70590.1 hypothetical protein CBR_g6716 [Chara braunii]